MDHPLPSQPVPRRPAARRRVPRATGPDDPEPSAVPPLPRRARHAADPTDERNREPARDPEGRLLQPLDDAVLHRLLTGLREI